MSVIVAVLGKREGVIASDAMISTDHANQFSCGPKFKRRGSSFVAFAGSCSVERRVFERPFPHFRGGDPERFIERIVATLRERFSRGIGNCELMIVAAHQIWAIDGDLATINVKDDYFAIGEGGPAARAVAWDLRLYNPEQRARRAIEASSHVYTTCGRGVHLARF